MDKKMIFGLILAIILAFLYYLSFDNVLVSNAVIFAFSLFAFNIFFDRILNKRRLNRDKSSKNIVDNEEVKSFIEVIGGINNIITVDSESSRLKVVIKDTDLINQDKLKELPLGGAYLAGNQLQITIGSGSSEFLRQVNEAIQ